MKSARKWVASGGIIENVKMLIDRQVSHIFGYEQLMTQCAFITFLEAECAYRVLADLTSGPHSLVIGGNEVIHAI